MKRDGSENRFVQDNQLGPSFNLKKRGANPSGTNLNGRPMSNLKAAPVGRINNDSDDEEYGEKFD
jgi:hypothetical protein